MLGHLVNSLAFTVLARARALEAQGKNIVHLEIGSYIFIFSNHPFPDVT